jgi:hypothetical protein
MITKINIGTDNRRFFRQYLTILREFQPLDLLCNKELDLLAEFMYWNNELKDLPDEHKWKIIFHYDTKMKMKEHLKMSEVGFNNNLRTLRKKGFISKSKLTKSWMIYPDSENTLSINFNIIETNE